jgi:NAD(P)-dependent dehydrogenase (short-subunit alcohol dehydrogenase family)
MDGKTRMHGKTVVVTGAFGVLGRAAAVAAAERGAPIAASSLEPSPPADLAHQLGRHALILGGVDLSSHAAAKTAMAEVKIKFGRLDVLFNIAGGFEWEAIDGVKPESWDRLYTLNLKTALYACQGALPYLIESGAGRIVNVGAQSALRPTVGLGAYAASKSAVHRLTESLADELKLRGVTVNAVLPSIIDTPANRREMPGADFDRWVKPADLAAVMLFLASDEAQVITGALIPVSGKT